MSKFTSSGRFFPSDDFFIELYPEDKNRARIVPVVTGKAGKWFSLLIHRDDNGYIVVPKFAYPEE